ncbi:MAG: amidohydrolase family protein [Planctomycetota bacterium]|nr:amidohydrolase family protein [Planctomycetota bacterium]
MVVDSHLHVWRGHQDYPEPNITTISPLSDVPVELLTQYMEEYGVDRAVLVQPLFPGEDNSYVADCAQADPTRFAAVCVVDPRREDAPQQLSYWVEERGCRGLRLRPKVPAETECFGAASTYDLWEKIVELDVTVSLLADAKHLTTVDQLATRFPAANIVIDHLAHPDLRGDVPSAEFQQLLQLSRHPRVFVKTSGFGYYSEKAFPYADCHLPLQMLLDHFGPERLIWGSDFPHILLVCGYRRAMAVVEYALPGISAKVRAQIMGENAYALYWRD